MGAPPLVTAGRAYPPGVLYATLPPGQQLLHRIAIGPDGCERVGLVIGVVARAHERAGLNDLEAARQALLLERRELLGRDPAVDGEVVARGLEVLPDREDVAGILAGAGGPLNVIEQVDHFLVALADADHDARLRDAALLLHPPQQLERAVELGARPHRRVDPADRLEVVVDDVGLGVDDHLERGPVALEVRDQDFDGHLGAGFARADDGLGPDGRAPVLELVAVDARDHHVLEAHERKALRHAPRLVLVPRPRPAGLDVAKPAGAGAGVAQYHDGGHATGPALAHVRAAGLLADRVELVLVHDAAEALVARAPGHLGPQPRGLALDGERVLRPAGVVKDHSRET